MTEHAIYLRKRRKENPEYFRQMNQRSRHKMDNYFHELYYRIQRRCKGTGQYQAGYIGLPFMSSELWNVFLTLTYPTRKRLFDAYKASGFKRGLAPSVDRIDNRLGYLFDNCQWLTQSENASKGRIVDRPVVPVCAKCGCYVSNDINAPCSKCKLARGGWQAMSDIKNLKVEDEFYADCIRIEGTLYAKDLFRQWGKDGVLGGKFEFYRDEYGALSMKRLEDKPFDTPDRCE